MKFVVLAAIIALALAAPPSVPPAITSAGWTSLPGVSGGRLFFDDFTRATYWKIVDKLLNYLITSGFITPAAAQQSKEHERRIHISREESPESPSLVQGVSSLSSSTTSF